MWGLVKKVTMGGWPGLSSLYRKFTSHLFLYLALSAFFFKRLTVLDVDAGIFLEGLSNQNLIMTVDRYSLDNLRATDSTVADIDNTTTVRNQQRHLPGLGPALEFSSVDRITLGTQTRQLLCLLSLPSCLSSGQRIVI